MGAKNRTRLELMSRTTEGERDRLQALILEKDSEIQSLNARCESMNSGVLTLEDKCANLEATVDQLHHELKKEAIAEQEVRPIKIISALSDNLQLDRLESQIKSLKGEKVLLEQRLGSWKKKAEDLKESKERSEERISTLENELQCSESRANALKIEIETKRSQMENSTNDNYFKEELARHRRENESLYQKLQEANRKLRFLESDKAELETKLEKSRQRTSSSMSSEIDSRSPIPLVGGATKNQHHNLLKVKLAEQETERQRRKS